MSRPQHKSRSVEQIGMADVRLRLPELAAALARDPDRVIEVTRRGRPVLHLVAAPKLKQHAGAARRILQRVAQLEHGRARRKKNVARRYKDLLYGRP
jgi:antitoxin (DNA-binding transcriptional repressor) of toxin-antitoxin stability system